MAVKGRTWCIEFLDEAKKDGDISVTWTVINNGIQQNLAGTWEGYKKGMTARQKADRFYNKLSTDPGMSQLVSVVRAGNTVCFQLKEAAPYDDIAGIRIGDETGQTFRIFDDPERTPRQERAHHLETVRFALSGVAATRSGVVRLGIGLIPSPVSVPTFVSGKPLTVATILKKLAAAFNDVFGESGFNATVENNEVVIPEVPCETGVAGGSSDTGLQTALTLEDPGGAQLTGDFNKMTYLTDLVFGLHERLLHLEKRQPGHAPVEDEIAQRIPCHGIIIEAGGRFFLACDGSCTHGECKPRTSRNHHGGIREWCGCSTIEPHKGCHVVIYTPGPGEGGGPQEVICAGACEDENGNVTACKHLRVPITPPGFVPPIFLHSCVC